MEETEPISKMPYVGISLFVLVAAVAIINTIANYAKNETLEVDSLHTFKNMVLTKSPQKFQLEETSKCYYLFSFAATKHRFSLHEKYYNYSRSGLSLSALKAGDTLSIQLTPEDLKCYNDLYDSHIVEMVNFSRGNAKFIDLSHRNDLITAENKKTMQRWWLGAAVVGIVFVLIPGLVNRWLRNTQDD